MSTPNRIFDIARESAIARHFTEAWLRGRLDWEVMLFELANALEKQCNRLVDQNNLRETITKNQVLPTVNYVLEQTLIPDLHDIKDPIERQRKLISSILMIYQYYKIVLSFVVNSITFRNPVLVIESSNLCNLKFLNEFSEQGILRKIAEYQTGSDRPQP